MRHMHRVHLTTKGKAQSSPTDQERDTRDEAVGRDREDPPRFAHTSQVGSHHERNGYQAQPLPVRVEGGDGLVTAATPAATLTETVST